MILNIIISIISISAILFNTVTSKQFNAYWNIPTFMCRKAGFKPLNVTEKYGISQNNDDAFRGQSISILYDPGLFPALLQNSSSNELFRRNGGVPQEGNLTKHIEVFVKHLDELIPDLNMNGIAIIDFESWRPVFRQNFGSLQPYKDLSIKLVHAQHRLWPRKRIENEAMKLFEKYARIFMEKTINIAKELRPNAKWGYYGLPLCFNRGTERCADGVIDENNGIQWLFDASDIIYPSVYMEEKMSYDNRIKLVRGRTKEAIRVANQVKSINKPPVLVYHRYVFTDTRNYLSEMDTLGALGAMKSTGANGVILWGSSNDLNQKKKCETFYNYLDNVLGPVVQSFEINFRIEEIQSIIDDS